MPEIPIDLRSDTVTRPTPGMRAAMAAAEVGDDVFGDDPTVNRLQERVADLLGKEAALFVPSGTMSNQLAVKVHTQPGDEIICDVNCHIYNYEGGGPAWLSGVMCRTIEGQLGIIDLGQIEGCIRPDNEHYVRTRLVCLENTHNRGSGRIYPLEKIKAIAAWARKNSLLMHLDGARLMNASVASGVPASEIGRHFDAVTLCLSKGLGCPLGALVAGSEERMAKARRLKHLFGGAMRQAGVVAAAGVYALDHHVPLLADDHARARRLAEGWHAAGLAIALEQVETNFVQLDVEPLGLGKWDVIAALREGGVGVSNTVHPTRLRAVTHLDVSDEDIEAAIELAPEALAARV